ncbi:MAG: MATE family efflux transporter [Eubacteriales bacterium]
MKKDLLHGSPIKVIISFALPILFGNLFQQIYSMIDSIIVGKFVGVEALAGVGATSALNWFIIGFIVGTSNGFAIPIAQCFGAKDYSQMKRYYTNAMYIAVFISIVVTAMALVFVDPILRLMQTPEDMYQYSKTYVQTIFMGVPGIFLYNYLASVLRGIGDSKTPLYFLVGASILNIILDLILVLVFQWGVFGTGFATVISQTLAGILCMILIIKKFDILKTSKEDWGFSWKHIKRLCYMGFPMGLQFSITAIGGIILQSYVNTLGSAAVAAMTAATKVNIFACQGLEAIGLAMATFSSQNLGAGKISRISQGVKQSILVGFVYTFCVFVTMLFASGHLALLFVSKEETVIIKIISEFLQINTFLYIFLGVLLVLRYTIQGLGYSMFAMLAGVTEMFSRMLCGMFLVTNLGYMGAILSGPIAWLSACLFLIPAYFLVMKKIKGNYGLKEENVVQ